MSRQDQDASTVDPVAIVWDASSEALYRSAMYGELKSSSPTTSVVDGLITNRLQVPIDIFAVDELGGEYLWTSLSYDDQSATPAGVSYSGDLYSDTYYIVRASGTGAFAAVFETAQSEVSFEIVPQSLIIPNCLGPVPTPTVLQVVPGNTPRVLVGAATNPSGSTFILREQLWRRNPNSFSLADGENVTIDYTITSGKTSESSAVSDVSMQLSSSISAGWGPISSSISGRLTASSRCSNEFSITESSTQSHSNTCQNTSGKTVMFLRWQMIDIVTLVPIQASDGRGQFGSAKRVEIGLEPVVTSGPWDINNLPDDPVFRDSQTMHDPMLTRRRIVERREYAKTNRARHNVK